MRVEHRQVVRGHIEFGVRQSNEHGTVHSRVCLEYLAGRLVSRSAIRPRQVQWCVGEIQLRQPRYESRLPCCR